MVIMGKETVLHHIAVHYSDEQTADRFFVSLLGLSKTKTSRLSEDLSEKIFGIRTSVQIIMYENSQMRCEVFISQMKRQESYDHFCIEVDNTNDFVTRCRTQGLEPFAVEKNGKKLLFLRDFSSHLYEIK